jgi:hypothetical protein
MKLKTKRNVKEKEKESASFFEKPSQRGSIECLIEINTFGI